MPGGAARRRTSRRLRAPRPREAGDHARFIDHPYLTAYTRGQQRVADATAISLKTMVANNDVNVQAQQTDQAINERPDLVIITPVDATAAVPLVRKLNRAGIPVIASNLLLADQGMKYVLTWTGPDDWGGFRQLAREFAKRMNYEGGYVVVRHVPGTSPYVSRTYAMVTELQRIAPKMQLLDMQTTDLQAEKTLQVVGDWITRFGPRLKGHRERRRLGRADRDQPGREERGREDIVRVAAGNSKIGMDFVAAGELAAITVQSAEADGALPMKLAADWFNGQPIAKPVYYLPKAVITRENVAQYQPAQW
jgi:ribose transport system substrate-binding protein